MPVHVIGNITEEPQLHACHKPTGIAEFDEDAGMMYNHGRFLAIDVYVAPE